MLCVLCMLCISRSSCKLLSCPRQFEQRHAIKRKSELCRRKTSQENVMKDARIIQLGKFETSWSLALCVASEFTGLVCSEPS